MSKAATQAEAAVDSFRNDYHRTREEIAKAVVGHDEIVDGVLVSVCLRVDTHFLKGFLA